MAKTKVLENYNLDREITKIAERERRKSGEYYNTYLKEKYSRRT